MVLPYYHIYHRLSFLLGFNRQYYFLSCFNCCRPCSSFVLKGDNCTCNYDRDTSCQNIGLIDKINTSDQIEYLRHKPDRLAGIEVPIDVLGHRVAVPNTSRLCFAQRVAVLFQTWDGHFELFQDIFSNFGTKLVTCSREKLVMAKEVLVAGPQPRTILETTIVTLAHSVQLPLLLPSLILHDDISNMNWIAKVASEPLAEMMKNHSVDIFSVCNALHCSKKAGWRRDQLYLKVQFWILLKYLNLKETSL